MRERPNPSSNGLDHAARVDAWLAASGAGLDAPAVLRRFESAFAALWRRCRGRLGEVTLMAIADRVLCDGRRRHAFLDAAAVTGEGISVERLVGEANARIDPGEARAAVGFILIEFLRVLGRLTAEVLSPALHGELSNGTWDEHHGTR